MEELKIGVKVWTMLGKRPVKMEITKINPLSPRFPNIWLINECEKTCYTRRAEDLFKTYEELRNFVFPLLKKE